MCNIEVEDSKMIKGPLQKMQYFKIKESLKNRGTLEFSAYQIIDYAEGRTGQLTAEMYLTIIYLLERR